MRILYASLADSASQGFLLCQALRDFLGYDAKSVVARKTYLNYETDWTFEENRAEVKEFAENADLFIFQDLLFGVPGGPKFNKLCSPANTVIHVLGSPARANLPAVMDYVKTGFNVCGPMSDPTIAKYLPNPGWENVMVDPKTLELTKDIKRNDKITVCTATTRDKGEEEFKKATEELGLEWILIKGKPWKEAIREKAKAHILLDSLTDVSYGISAIESALMGQVCVGRISPWCYAMNNSLPIINTTPKTVKQSLEKAIDLSAGDEIYYKNHAIKWAKSFLPENKIKSWEYYIDFVMEA